MILNSLSAICFLLTIRRGAVKLIEVRIHGLGGQGNVAVCAHMNVHAVIL